VESAAQRLAHDIRQPTRDPPDAGTAPATEAVRDTVDALRPPRRCIREHCARIKAVEKENDRLLRRATAKLFMRSRRRRADQVEGDLRHVEAAADLCEDVANVVEGVVIENA
jgi:uncharacterized protein Yka (UPF0111/DUF47 family)